MVAADLAGLAGEHLPVVVDRSLPASELSPVLNALTVAGVTKVRLITLRARGAGRHAGRGGS